MAPGGTEDDIGGAEENVGGPEGSEPGALDGQLPTWTLPKLVHQLGAEAPGSGGGAMLGLMIGMFEPPVMGFVFPGGRSAFRFWSHEVPPSRSSAGKRIVQSLAASRSMKKEYGFIHDSSRERAVRRVK